MRPFGPGSSISAKPSLDPTPKPDLGTLDVSLGDPAPDVDAPLTLSKDQLAAAGLDDLKMGQSFTVTVTGTATKVDDQGVTADISDAVNGEVNTDENGGSEDTTGDDDQFQAPKGKIEMGPDGMKGF